MIFDRIRNIFNQPKPVKLTPEEQTRYNRHIILPEIGEVGQLKLKSAKVILIGAGGLGSPVALYLASAGVGTLGIIDFDIVDSSNLQRQILFNEGDIRKSKAETARDKLSSLNSTINVKSYNEKLTAENAKRLIEPYDIIVDGSDNFSTRYLVNDSAVLLNKPLVYGSIYRFDGQVTLFNYQGGPCYRCIYPEPPEDGTVPSCADAGVFGVIPGIVGSLQAAETIKLITGSGSLLSKRLMVFDALGMNFSTIEIERNSDCPVCGDSPSIKELRDQELTCAAKGTPIRTESNILREIDVKTLKSRIDKNDRPFILDVREKREIDFAPMPHAVHIIDRDIPARINELNVDDEIVIVCRSGVRSAEICLFLMANGFKSVYNLHGGIRAWAMEIDPSVPLY